jgi:hypothetical protein
MITESESAYQTILVKLYYVQERLSSIIVKRSRRKTGKLMWLRGTSFFSVLLLVKSEGVLICRERLVHNDSNAVF